jgi:hypothetical protein
VIGVDARSGTRNEREWNILNEPDRSQDRPAIASQRASAIRLDHVRCVLGDTDGLDSAPQPG